MTTPEGWYDDGSGNLRWWDGQQWTAHVRTATPPTPATPAAVQQEAVAPIVPPIPLAPGFTAPGAATQIEPEPFAPPYALPGQVTPGAAAAAAPVTKGMPFPQGQGFPAFLPPSPAAPRMSVVGIIGLAVAVLGVIIACIPPIAIAGWGLLAAGFVTSLVSLFFRGAKWPGITGMSVTVVGTILALAVSLVVAIPRSPVEAGGDPVPGPDTSTDGSVDPSDIEGADMTPFDDLEVGDCLPYVDYGDEEAVFQLPVVSCDQLHTDEVYFIYQLDDGEFPGGEFPGDDAMSDATWDRCMEEFETFVGVPWEDSELGFYNYQPTKATWSRAGDRTVHCIAYSYDDVTGTLHNAKR